MNLRSRKFVQCFVLIVLQISMVDLTGDSSEGDFENDVHDLPEKETLDNIHTKINLFIPITTKDNCNSGESYGFCVDIENYPVDYIRNKLATDKKFRRLAVQTVKVLKDDDSSLPLPSPTTYSSHSSSFPSRRHYQDKEMIETLCQSVSRMMYIKSARNKNGDWMYIVNQDNYTQGVVVEECVDSGKPCQMTQSFPIGYRTECRQEYSSRVLLSVDAQGEMRPDLFPLPSCCKCVLHREYN